MKKRKLSVIGIFAGLLSAGMILTGCGDSSSDNGKIKIEMVQYKPEAVKAFEKMEEKFNASHDDIELTIESPNEAMTILKTRFIKEDQPDIIGIGGDVNYSNFLDADMLTDISDFEGLADIKQAYLDIDKNLEFISRNGVYAVPYAANAAGILYNKDMFEENGWEIPTTWEEFLTLLDTIQASGQQPLYFGFKDTWTCLAPWNAMACDLCSGRCMSAGKQRRNYFFRRLQGACGEDFSFFLTHRMILMLTAIMMHVQPLLVGNLPCTASEAMRCLRSNP